MIKTYCIAIIGIFTLQFGALQAKEAYLAKAGKPQGRLFVPAQNGRALLFAVDELRHYFQKLTGAELPMAWRAPTRKDSGIQLQVRKRDDWQGKESAQCFTIEERVSPQPMVIITGNTETAVLYGVYQYLHELGVRWFSPGEIGENVPKRKNIVIKKRKKSYTPSFINRGLSVSGTASCHFDNSDRNKYRDIIHHDYDLWLLRNRVVFQRSIHSGHWFDFNSSVVDGGHHLRKYALKGADIKQEPERFALVTRKGIKKRRDKGVQLCFTNEKNIQQAIENVVAYFKKQDATKAKRNTDLDELSDTCAIGLADHSGICECENCLKVAGSPPYDKDRLVWAFYNKVARGVDKQMPGKKIGLFAPYFELHRPPVDVRIEPNIVAVSCRGTTWDASPENQAYYPFTKKYMQNIDATRKAGAEMRCYDYVMWKGTPQPLSILDAAEVYKKLGYKRYHTEVMGRNEQIWPILWALAQYTWNSEQKPRKLLKEYCDSYYGKAGNVVFELLNAMDQTSKKVPKIIYGGIADTQMIMSDDLIASGRKKLDEAIKGVTGKEVKRLERFRDTFEMFARTAETYRSYCKALNLRTAAAIADSQKQFADYELFWKKKNLSTICSPSILKRIQGLAKIDIKPETAIQRSKALIGKTAKDKEWRRQLFAFDTVPEYIPNLFPLPEIWNIKIDYDNRGLAEEWQKTELIDDKTWQPVSTWNFYEKQGYNDINGHFWYRLTFKAPKFPAGKKVFMRIGSLDDEGDIYINGKLAYSRKGIKPNDWQSSFAFEVTKFIKQGKENTIAVRGYDSFGAGGIWRPVALYTD